MARLSTTLFRIWAGLPELRGLFGLRPNIAFCLLASLFPALYFSPKQHSGGLFIHSREGQLLREFRSTFGSYQGITGQLSAEQIRILLLAEDRYFFYHPGINPFSILRATYQSLSQGRIVSGASTLSQQLARIDYGLERYPVMLRKALEIPLALYLDWHLSKDDLIHSYSNSIPLRNNSSGYAAAAERIFGRSAHLLSPAEWAALVVLGRQSQLSRSRFRLRLQRLLASGNIRSSDAEVEEIVRDVFRSSARVAFADHSGHFTTWLYQLDRSLQGRFDSTIRAQWQEKIRDIVQNELKILESFAVEEAAVVVLSLHDDHLELEALVGSQDFDSGQVNGALAVRHAGSTLKPFLYALSMEGSYRPYTMIEDRETHVPLRGEVVYSPRNYDLNHWGQMSLRTALATSRNSPAIALLQSASRQNFYRLLKRGNLIEQMEGAEATGPGMALGAGGVRLLHLCRAYGALASRGRLLPLHLGERLIYGKQERLVSERSATYVTHILSDRQARRMSYQKRNFLDFPFAVAAKTGTSKDFKDAWTVGYSPDFVVGVWAGNFTGKPMNHVSGSYGAGRIFQQVMRLVNVRRRPFAYPGWKKIQVCPASGQRARQDCPLPMEEIVAPDEAGPPLCEASHGEEQAASLRAAEKEFRIESPLSGAQYVLDAHQRIEEQGIPFIMESPGSSVCLRLNERDLTCFDDRLKTTFVLKRGAYRLEVIVAGQKQRTIEFRVR